MVSFIKAGVDCPLDCGPDALWLWWWHEACVGWGCTASVYAFIRLLPTYSGQLLLISKAGAHVFVMLCFVWYVAMWIADAWLSWWWCH